MSIVEPGFTTLQEKLEAAPEGCHDLITEIHLAMRQVMQKTSCIELAYRRGTNSGIREQNDYDRVLSKFDSVRAALARLVEKKWRSS